MESGKKYVNGKKNQMTKIFSDDQLISSADIKEGSSPLTNIIRMIFVSEKITIGDYISSYRRYFSYKYPDKSGNQCAQKIIMDRAILLRDDKLSEKTVRRILGVMGYEIISLTYDNNKAQIIIKNPNEPEKSGREFVYAVPLNREE